MQINDYPICFKDNSCPACANGKLIPQIKRDITVGYICDKCGTNYLCEYTDDFKTPHPLYLNSKVQKLLNKFKEE